MSISSFRSLLNRPVITRSLMLLALWVVFGVLTVNGGGAAWAQDALSTLEQQVYGRAFAGESDGIRLRRLEKSLNFVVKPGLPEAYRLENLYAAYQVQRVKNQKHLAVKAYNQGVDAASAGKFEPAIAFYREAIRLEPDFLQAYNNLGNLLERLQRFKEAISVYQYALRQMASRDKSGGSPQYSENLALMHRNLGILFEKTGNIETSLVEYGKYLKMSRSPDPNIARIYHQYYAQKKEGEKEADYVRFAREASHGDKLLWDRALNPIPVYIQLDEDQVMFLPVIQQALRLWEKATQGRIKFHEVGVPVQALIKLRLQEGPLAHPDLQVGFARYDVSEGDEEQGDSKQLKVEITVNTGERNIPISLEDRSRVVRRLALHELGHAVGIWGHSPSPGDIMYARPIANDLSNRDVRTINRLYQQ